jgi:hypothetical protein
VGSLVAPIALAALPIADKGGQVLAAGADIAKSVTAQIAAALGTPLLSWENVRTRPTTRGGVEVQTSKTSLPAWFVVGGLIAAAGALWVAGLQFGVDQKDGKDRIGIRNRAPLRLPFADPGGGSAGGDIFGELFKRVFWPW